MTVLDVDPPRPRLQLVGSNGPTTKAKPNSTPAATGRGTRDRSRITLHSDARRLYRAVLEHALASGDRVNPEALRVVLAVKQAASTSEPITRFTGTGIWQLMFVDVAAWCRHGHVAVPPGCDKALWAIVSFLQHTAGFAPGSDDLVELLEAIEDCSGGTVLENVSRLLDRANVSHPTRRSRGSLPSQRGPKRS